jgi:hypothetical protein
MALECKFVNQILEIFIQASFIKFPAIYHPLFRKLVGNERSLEILGNYIANAARNQRSKCANLDR